MAVFLGLKLGKPVVVVVSSRDVHFSRRRAVLSALDTSPRLQLAAGVEG